MPVDWVQFNWMWINRIDHLCIRFSCGSKSYNDYFLFITPVDHVLVKIFSFILPSQLERSLSCTRPTMNGEAPSCYSAKQSIKKILTCQLNFFFLIPVCPFSYFWVVLIIMAILKLAFYFLLFFSFFLCYSLRPTHLDRPVCMSGCCKHGASIREDNTENRNHVLRKPLSTARFYWCKAHLHPSDIKHNIFFLCLRRLWIFD